MAMEGVRSAIVAAALLFLLTPAVLAASAISSDDDDDAAASAVAAAEERWYHPPADEPYALVAFQKDGEEIRLLDDQRCGASAFANGSGHWFFYASREPDEGKRRRPPVPALPQSKDKRSRGEGLWTTLAALSNTTAAADAADDEQEQGYVLVGMETSGGDKVRFVVVAGQRYFCITSFARGWFRQPNWFFREGERHRLLTSKFGGSGSHAELVASNVLLLASMMKDKDAS